MPTIIKKLISDILDHYQTMIIESNNRNWISRFFCARLPDTFIVSQKPYCKDELILLVDETIRKWKITQNEIKEVALDYDLEFNSDNSLELRYSKRSLGFFWISDDNRIIHIGYMAGPLNGQGWDYEVINNDGRIHFKKQKRLWQS